MSISRGIGHGQRHSRGVCGRLRGGLGLGSAVATGVAVATRRWGVFPGGARRLSGLYRPLTPSRLTRRKSQFRDFTRAQFFYSLDNRIGGDPRGLSYPLFRAIFVFDGCLPEFLLKLTYASRRNPNYVSCWHSRILSDLEKRAQPLLSKRLRPPDQRARGQSRLPARRVFNRPNARQVPEDAS